MLAKYARGRNLWEQNFAIAKRLRICNLGIKLVHIRHVNRWLPIAELAKVDDYSQDQQRHESQNTNSNTQSSMETVPCDLIDGEFSGEDEEAEETQLWARLMPLGPGFVTVGR